ncbi:MAG TPA: hypothetical protein VKG24_03445 [Pseudolabrys sp.]|nr:hypothetical protein [Pseudolabrys sp.]
MAKRDPRDEYVTCNNLQRNVGERASGAKQTFRGDSPGTITNPSGVNDVFLVDIGKPNSRMARNSNKGR